MGTSAELQPLKQRITLLLREKGSRLLAIRDIHSRLSTDPSLESSREDVEAAIEELESEGVVTPVRGKRYALLEFTSYLSGKLRVYGDGYGVVASPGDEPDIYIDRRLLKGAMNGDVVLVYTDPRGARTRTVRGRKYLEGEVSRVLQREHRTVVGRFHAGDLPFVRPFDERIDSDIDIASDATMNARDGEMVNVEIDRYGSRTSGPAGRIIERLGMIGEPGVDIEVVLRKYHIPHDFPPEVLDAAETIESEVAEEEIANREDLRDREIVTIDGETAKDFDDAVEVRMSPAGNFILGVHIADVAHYVTEGSELDKEAFERGTSVYFPGRAVPMLPERLSNGICSLNPQVNRLTFSCEIEIDRRGKFVKRRLFKSVIRTVERMTYTSVNAILSEPTPELRERYNHLFPLFERMHELFEILRVRRDARGSIDFDLPEADVRLGEEGQIEAIEPSERNVAHRLIEEFMLAANEVVAEELSFASQPALYRIHQTPDAQKIADMKEILKEFKHRLRGNPEEIRPGELQQILKEVAGSPEERFLTELILRSMKRALYSEESTGHFALALQYYCHFTSPIRRYPDLIVHRMLARLLSEGSLHGSELEQAQARFPVYAIQCSEREKRAESAEREVLEWKKVIFMRDKVGEQFSGRITGVLPFGFFVELDQFFIQGLVPVSSIGGEYWVYLDREHKMRGDSSGREFRLGDQVIVEVHGIDEDRRQIEFRLLESGGVRIARDRL